MPHIIWDNVAADFNRFSGGHGAFLNYRMDNIYKILFYFDKMYAVMDEAERRHLMESLIDEIQICEERQPNGCFSADQISIKLEECQ